MKKWGIILLYIFIILIGFQYKGVILSWVNSGDGSQVPLMFLLSIFFALFPVVPFTVFAGLMGAKYGPLLGAFINWVGALVAAIIMFLLSRYVFAKQARNYLKRFKGLRKLSDMFEENALFTVLFARLIPVVPTPVINIYAGISIISFMQYMTATALGKIPAMLVFALVGNQIFTSMRNLVLVIFVYIVFLSLVYTVYRWWTKVYQPL